MSMRFLWAISSTERPSGASTSRRMPSRSIKISLGIPATSLGGPGPGREVIPGREVFGEDRGGQRRRSGGGAVVSRDQAQQCQPRRLAGGLQPRGKGCVRRGCQGHNGVRHRLGEGALGAQPRSLEQALPLVERRRRRRHREVECEALAIGEQRRIAADRHRHFGSRAARIDADRDARRVRIDG